MNAVTGDPKALVQYRANLEEIFKRLLDIERQMKVAMNPAVVNDLMNAIQRIQDVLGNMNLGKLATTFQNLNALLDNMQAAMSNFAPV